MVAPTFCVLDKFVARVICGYSIAAFSLSHMQTVSKKLIEKISPEEGRIKRFGAGRPELEQKCPEFRVYAACQGRLATEKRVLTLPRGSTIEDVRHSFGRPMAQQLVVDEDAYELQPTDPLYQHSNNCNLSLCFKYAEFHELKQAAAQAQTLAVDLRSRL